MNNYGIAGRVRYMTNKQMKLNPLFVETKSRRVQFIMQPSLYAKVKEQAIASGVSVNDYIHAVLEAATTEDGHE